MAQAVLSGNVLEPVKESKHWSDRYRTVLLILATVGALVLALFAFEAVHWAIEGFPPPREHAVEMLHHLAAVLAKTNGWMW